MSTYTCQRAIHPGEILKEEVEYRGIKQTRLAEQIQDVKRHSQLPPSFDCYYSIAL